MDVPLSSAADSAQNPTDVDQPAALGEWDCKANDVITFKLDSGGQAGEWGVFGPTLTHQVFENQLIRGYKRPRVSVLYTADSLLAFLRFDYDEKRFRTPLARGEEQQVITDVPGLLAKWLPPSGVASSFDDFAREVGRPFEPPGDKIHSYTVESSGGSGTSATDDGTTVEYEIRKGSFAMEDLRQYHERIQLFLIWFIDRSSYIDDTDLDWELYFIFEKRRTFGETRYSIVGYATVYPFFSFPDQRRLRISQFLILPPFQKQGHGEQLLRAIYREAWGRTGLYESVRDITVEDPSPEFKLLRDITDLRLCLESGFLKGVPGDKIDPEQLRAVQSRFKLAKSQIEHLHEVLRYVHLDRCDEQVVTRFRLSVKRRLHKKYQDWLAGFEAGEARKKELDDIYREEIEGVYSSLARRLRTHLPPLPHSPK
ncbi:histone acetyltransferase type b catalytic subunit [Acanthamoeba castellanii str. Neff]|uniref:histone acetyltransferase n=1 Tax=Acanthamoeba castellanii (strain ATCC 30010 / Neff) TaxID=1257118 RepID=L8HGP6_ACACF|nr:histone acetyltransferase type b catalytic subunit [Acanthamoeba castellanii str. Neff]ELR24340.1 histone acetyltransferase type b catalytic subunit [Acanthamoeba castellanii str. Neff]